MGSTCGFIRIFPLKDFMIDLSREKNHLSCLANPKIIPIIIISHLRNRGGKKKKERKKRTQYRNDKRAKTAIKEFFITIYIYIFGCYLDVLLIWQMWVNLLVSTNIFKNNQIWKVLHVSSSRHNIETPLELNTNTQTHRYQSSSSSSIFILYAPFFSP